MKFFKSVSDELWLGILFLLVAVWVFALNTNYIIISGIFLFIGIILIIVDNLKKLNKIKEKNVNK